VFADAALAAAPISIRERRNRECLDLHAGRIGGREVIPHEVVAWCGLQIGLHDAIDDERIDQGAIAEHDDTGSGVYRPQRAERARQHVFFRASEAADPELSAKLGDSVVGRQP